MDARIAIVAADGMFAGAMAAALAGQGLSVETVAGSTTEIDLSSADLVVLASWTPAEITSIAGHARPVVLIDGGSDEMLTAIAAGAVGVVEADATFDRIAEAVRQVVGGHAVVPPSMLGALLRNVVERHRKQREALESLKVLTPREREVFELTARGLDRDQIAESLFISPATARTHLQRVFAKLHIHSRAEAVALAARCGLDVEEP
jgi:DNA-binding NarL/FixJ family response regulator